MGLLAGFVVLAAAFAVGETLDDPGGWRGALLSASWIVPTGLLASLTWRRPDDASRLLMMSLAALLAADVWAAFAPHQWRSFENHAGPTRAVLAVAMAAALVPLAAKRPARGATLLAILGLAPAVLGIARPQSASAPLTVASVPIGVAGCLLLASLVARGSRGPGT